MHNAILQLCTNYQDNQYKVSVHLATIKSFFNLKQKKEEPLKDYVQRVEVGLKQLQGISRIVLTKEIDMNKYQAALDEEDRIALEDTAMDAMAGLIMVSGANKDYYSELQKDMQQQYARNQTANAYPSDIQEAYLMLKAYRDANVEEFKNVSKKKAENKKKQSKDKDNQANNSSVGSLFAQDKQGGAIVCHCCGKPNEKAYQCSLKKSIPEDQWYKNTKTEWYKKPPKSMSFIQEASVIETTAVPDENVQELQNILKKTLTEKQMQTAKQQGWCNLSVCLFNDQTESIDLRRLVLLDNQSTHSVYGNPNLVKNI